MNCDCCFIDCPNGHHTINVRLNEEIHLMESWCDICYIWINSDNWVPNGSGNHEEFYSNCMKCGLSGHRAHQCESTE